MKHKIIDPKKRTSLLTCKSIRPGGHWLRHITLLVPFAILGLSFNPLSVRNLDWNNRLLQRYSSQWAWVSIHWVSSGTVPIVGRPVSLREYEQIITRSSLRLLSIYTSIIVLQTEQDGLNVDIKSGPRDGTRTEMRWAVEGTLWLSCRTLSFKSWLSYYCYFKWAS